MKARVNEIAKPWGMQEKKDGGKFGPAMFVHLAIEDGEEARWVLVWKEVQVGDTIEVEKKGQYWNAVSEKQAGENAKHDEIMSALRLIMAEIKALKGQTVSSANLPPKTTVGAPKAVDEVFPVNEDEPINLSDIPF